MNSSESRTSESRTLKTQSLLALGVALCAWIALYVGYSTGSFLTLLLGAGAFVAGLIWLLAALVIGYVRERSS